MPYITMKQILLCAKKGGYASGAFNIFNWLTASAVINECEKQEVAVILQTSVKTVKKFSPCRLAEMLIPMAKNAKVPVALHLDHCRDVEFAKACIDAGWNSIMYDGSSLPLEENIAKTREVVEYGRKKGVTVEGELGAITGVEEEIQVEDGKGALADVGLSGKFVEESGIDAFAPAIGTAHGLYNGEPHVDYQRFRDICSAVAVPLVVHGGTGLSDDTFSRLIHLGACKINISTAIKIAYLDGMKLCGNIKEPLQADELLERRVRDVVKHCIEVFGNSPNGCERNEI